MLDSERHEGHPKNGVWPGGKDGNRLVTAFDLEIAGKASAFADPVALHGYHFFRPAGQPVEISKQFFGIVGDFEKPAVHGFGQHWLVATPAGAVNDLLAGKNSLAVVTPVDRGFLAIDQALLQHLEEKYLLPTIIVRSASGQFPVPIVAQAHGFELTAHVIDVVVRPGGGMDAAFHRRVLGRQAISIPTHGVKNVETLHPFIAGDDVANGIVAHMAHMNPAGWIRKHFKNVVLRSPWLMADLIGLFLFPALLPSLFDDFEVVLVVGWHDRLCCLLHDGQRENCSVEINFRALFRLVV